MAPKAKLFKSVPDAERRKLRIPVLVNEDEKSQIEHAAQIRNLAASDWMRRAALGRKADVRYDTQTVIAVTQLVQAIRETGAGLQAISAAPDPQAFEQLLAEMRETIGAAKAALQRIDK